MALDAEPEVMEEVGMMKNTANTNIVRRADRLLALMEAVPPTELTSDLGTVGEWDFAVSERRVDAQGLEEVARVRLPRRVLSGFHGNWMAESS